MHRANDRSSEDGVGGPGTKAVTFEPGQRVAWGSARPSRNRRACMEDWSVEFVVADQNLYRNVSIAPHSLYSKMMKLIRRSSTDQQRYSRPGYLPTAIEHALLAQGRLQFPTSFAASAGNLPLISVMDSTPDSSIRTRLL